MRRGRHTRSSNWRRFYHFNLYVRRSTYAPFGRFIPPHIISVRCCGGRSTKEAKNATECCFVVALVSVIVSAAGCPLFKKYYVGLLLSRHVSMVGAMNLERRAFLTFL